MRYTFHLFKYRAALVIKSCIIFLLLFSGFINHAHSTHIMAMDITYVCVGGNDYIFTVRLYRDCAGTSAPATNTTLTFQSASCGEFFTLTLPKTGFQEVSQVCATSLPNTTCNGGTIPGTEEHTYVSAVTLPANCPDWIISWNLCCRNNAITNLQGPGSKDMYIQVTMDNTGGLCNNSPQYAANPVPYICANQLFTFNHGASDPDGDSLVYTLVQPLETPGPPGTLIPYAAGYTVNNPVLTTGGFIFNSLTGQMCFTPSVQQQDVVAVLIEEYRNGVLIATHIREMQVIVSSVCTNQPPTIAGTGGCGSLGGLINLGGGPSITLLDSNSVMVCPGDSVYFQIPYFDPEGDNITVIHTADSLSGASFITVNDTSTFEWLPQATDTGSNVFTVNLVDDACPIQGSQYFTFEILVLLGTSALPPVQTICDTQWASLSATGGTQFTWTVISGDPIVVGVNFSCDTCASSLARPDTTTMYEVVSNLASSCNDRDTVIVYVVPNFTYTKTQTDTGICLLEQVQFTVTPDSAGVHTYLWINNQQFLDADDISNPTATINVSGAHTFYFEITSPDGCTKTDSFTVEVSSNVQPVVVITGDTTICQGDSTQLEAVIISSTSTIEDDFDPGIDGTMWSNISGGTANTDCGSITGNALHFDNNASRNATTIPINANSCTTIDFCLVFGTGLPPCEDADPGENVELQYSTDGGITWILITVYLPNTVTTWTCFSEPVPAGAQTINTMFRWVQVGPFGSTVDNWSIDNVQINCSSNQGLTFSWSPSIGLSNASIVNPIAAPSTNITYTVYVVDTIGGCDDSASIDLYIVPNFTLTLTDNDTLCDLDTVQIEALVDTGGVYTYTWNNSTSLSDTTIFNPNAFPSSNTTYIVTVSSIVGCDKTDSITILVTQPPVLSIEPGDTTICDGQSVPFNIGSTPQICGLSTTGCIGPSNTFTVGTGTTSNTAFSYPAPYGNWYRNAKHQILYTAAELNALGFSGGTISEIAFNIAAINGTTVYDDFEIKMGCTSASSLTTWQTGLVTVFPPQTVNIALGWNTHIFANGFEWDGLSNIIIELCFDKLAVTYTNNSSTYFTPTGFTSVLYYRSDITPACPYTATQTISDNRPNIQFTVCNTFALNDFSLLWSPSADLSNDTIVDPIATPLSTTTYTLTVTHSETGCQYTKTQTVTVVQGFNIALVPQDTAVCLGESVQFNVAPDTAGSYTYQWSPATFLDNALISNPIGTMAAPGTFVYVITVNKLGGCIMTDSITVLVGPRNAPIVTVSASPDTLCSLGGVTQLTTVLTDTTVFNTIQDDFDPDIDTSMWSNISGGTANAFCGILSGNSLHFDNSASRNATTIAMNATSCTVIDFCLIFGSGASPCEDVDAGEEVELQYSIDGGITWILIANYDPNVYITWTCFSEPIPPGAQTINTMFRWVQVGSFGATIDNWAMDNVSISCGGGTTSYFYNWTPSTTLDDGTIANPIATLNSETVYTVVVTDSIGGCTATDSIRIYVEDPINVFIIQEDPLCITESPILLISTPFGGTWSGNGIIDINQGIFDPGTAGEGIHTIIYTATDICQSSDSVSVVVETEPQQVLITISNTGPFCGKSGDYFLTASPSGGMWTGLGILVNPSTGEFSSNISDTSNIQYQIITTSACGNDTSDTSATIIIFPAVKTSIKGIDESCKGANDGTAVLTTSGGTPPYFYLWSNGEIDEDVTSLAPGAYTVIITDNSGCTVTELIDILANPETCPLDIPNVFSPNDGDPENRTFKLYGLLPDVVKDVNFIVYSRWGEKVFEATNVEEAQNGWDGTKNGKPLPAGVFVYYIEVIMQGGDQIIQKGDVTLLR